ncbi:MAG TPA: aspartate kinase [Dehalococcoidia bacterium]|nr:aspartate kinase [Dehalococcoidia bacterium]
MSLVVQKYGGTSVADAERIKRVARRIADRQRQGDRVVAVVSAMGDTTDELIELARQITDQPPAREMDVLLSTGELVSSALVAMALHALGVPAVSLSGPQAGLRTDAVHRKARIIAVEPSRILREVERGRVVIVAGFQGITEEMDISTIGRGGSDTTAVAFAAALGARCEIYTDVDGVYTADPRIEPRARKLKDITYEEMLELASKGAKVMAPRAVELGSVYNIPILVASSFSDEPGTLIHGGVDMEQFNRVRGIAHDLDVAKITIRGVPDRPGIAAGIFEPLAEAHISVDTIVQNASQEGLTDLTFTVAKNELDHARPIVEEVAKTIGAREVVADERVGKVSIVGTGIQSAPGYAARMFRALTDANINIELISTSEIRITCIIAEDRVADAVRALHAAFELEKPEPAELAGRS